MSPASQLSQEESPDPPRVPSCRRHTLTVTGRACLAVYRAMRQPPAPACGPPAPACGPPARPGAA